MSSQTFGLFIKCTHGRRRGLTQHAQVLVGTPLLASPANLGFWIGLCSAWRVPGIAEEMERFRAHAARGAEQLEKFAFDYNSEMITKAGSALNSILSSCTDMHMTHVRLSRIMCNLLQSQLSIAFAMQVLAMPGVAGLHVMPLGKSARRLATRILVQSDQP